MSRATIGWAWVGAQAVLLLALVFIPTSDDWPTPAWVNVVGGTLFFGGLVFMGIAALRLGSSLTPTPVPTSGGSLKTGGLYALVRHPIYTGVLAVVLGIAVRSGSWIHAALAVAGFVFFDRKAAWEEAQLAERYPEYPEYAATTPKFVPRPTRHSRAAGT